MGDSDRASLIAMPLKKDVVDSVPSSAFGGLLLAVDAGGTKTAAWLVDAANFDVFRVLGRGRSTAGNPLSVGFEGATRAIGAAVAAAKSDAGRASDRVARAVLSIAGAANQQLRDQFISWARETGFAECVAIVSDVLPVLAAGTRDCRGVALISGTGSVAFGRGADGRTVLCGGWGYLLGDEGSGYTLGRAALRNALHTLEVSTHTTLSDSTLAAIGAASAMDVTRTIYRSADPRSAIAALAPVVIAAADAGDSEAQASIDLAANDLALLVARTIQLIDGEQDPVSLAVGGGVLAGSRRLRDQLEMELRRRGVNCETTVVEEPLEGCVRLAAASYSGNLVTWHDV